jgi:hypothetical protein
MMREKVTFNFAFIVQAPSKPMKRLLPEPTPWDVSPKLLVELKLAVFESAEDLKLIGLDEVPTRFCKEGNQRSTPHPITHGLRLGMNRTFHPEYIMGHCYGDRQKASSRPPLDLDDKHKLTQLKCKKQNLIDYFLEFFLLS